MSGINTHPTSGLSKTQAAAEAEEGQAPADGEGVGLTGPRC